jgi:hypothetical protein
VKVNIGKYKNYIGPYQIADLLQKIGVSEDRCYQIGTFLAGKDNETLLTKICNWVDKKRKRKVKIKIDKYDTWSMDDTLALIILPMLKQLRDTKHGSPGTMPAFSQTSNSGQYCFDFYAEGDNDAWDKGHEQWKEKLDEMIWAFEQLQPDCDWENQYWIVQPELDLSDYPEDEGKLSIPVRWKTEGKCDYEAMKKHSDRIQNGLELFGKHFTSLWD